jgi:PKD repeat protein
VAPAAVDDTVTTDEDESATVDVLANDSDVGDDPLNVASVTQPAHGTATTDGTDVTYTPEADYCGEDGLTYVVSDGALTNTAAVSVSVTCVNDPPQVEAGPDQAADEGDVVSLSGSFTDPDEGGTHTIAWNFDDGSTASNVLTPTHIYADDGAYTATLTVTDTEGESDSDTLLVTVENVAPEVEAGPDQTVDEGEEVTFSGSFSDPGVEDAHTITWDFGDGATASGTLSPTHVYTDDGAYTVTLTVADDEGGVGGDALLVTVENVAPAAVDDTVTTDEDESATVDVLANDSDVGDDPLNVASVTQPAHGTATTDGTDVTYTPEADYCGEDGLTYVVSDGALTNTAAVSVSVTCVNDPPQVEAGPDQAADEGDVVSLSGSFTDPDEGGTHTIAWNFDDGSTASNVLTPTHIYADDGAYTATLTVTDTEGESDSDTLLVTVENVAPTVRAWATPTLAMPRQAITFSGAFTDPGWLDTHTVEWNFGDGTSASGGLTVAHAFDLGGVYTATLAVTDDDGGVDQAAVAVGVTCELYPIALHVDTLAGVEVGEEIEDIYNGDGPGNFGWLSWTGDPSTPTLVESLTPPGDSDTYLNPYDAADHVLSVGDWVYGKPGVSNAKALRTALDNLESYVITVPVWDDAEGQGRNVEYHIVGYARVQITDYRLPGHDRISAIFRGYTDCGASCPNPAPIDLLYVLDVSGSMNYRYPGPGTKLEAAQEAILTLNEWISRLDDGSRVALLTYHGAGQAQGRPPHYPTEIELVSGFTDEVETLNAAVMDLEASNSTPTAAALEEVTSWLPGARESDHQPVVILISDGVPTVDLDQHGFADRYVERVSLYDWQGNFLSPQEVRARGRYYRWYRERAGEPLADTMVAIQGLKAAAPEATVYAVAVQGTRRRGIFNDDVLRYVAAQGDGAFFTARNASGLTAALQRAFADSACQPALPSPWRSRDVGNVGQVGNAVHVDGAFVVDGGGASVWRRSDEFHYVYRRLEGDGEIVARVTSVDGVHPWAQAGVMVREALGANSKHAMVGLMPWGAVAFQRRARGRGRSRYVGGDRVRVPYWVRLVREGETLTAYVSPDGAGWRRIGATRVAMAEEVYVGLAVTAHSDATLCTARFDRVRVSEEARE